MERQSVTPDNVRRHSQRRPQKPQLTYDPEFVILWQRHERADGTFDYFSCFGLVGYQGNR